MKKYLVLCVLMTGCVKYSHIRTTPDGGTERTSVSGFAGNAAVKNITSSVEDGNYKRSVGLGEANGESDTVNQAAALGTTLGAALKAAK